MKTGSSSAALATALMAVLSASLPANAQQTETRSLEGFDSIAVGGGIDLFVRRGDRFVVEVTAEDLADIVTEVRDGTLQIGRPKRSGFFSWGDLGSVRVTLPSLASLTASGGSDVDSEGTFSGDQLQLAASGGSDLTIDVSVDTLSVEASGGSDVRLSGSARSAHLESSGGSDLNATQFTADEANVNSSGGSDLAIAVRDKLVANASGGSDVSYTGEPSSVNVNSSGGADVHRR
jgi:hypothetical protein